MADNYIIPVTLFGNYSVTGDLLLLGKDEGMLDD
jgi:hypothetical protein